MKKIIFPLILFIISLFFISPFAEAQYVYPFLEDTVSNSIKKTAYLYLEQFKKSPGEKIDSVTIITYAVGEIDIDLLTVTPGVDITDPAYDVTAFYAAASADSTTMTTNLDSAVTKLENIVTKTYSNLDGVNVLKCIFHAAASGNDATDENYLLAIAFVWTSKP